MSREGGAESRRGGPRDGPAPPVSRDVQLRTLKVSNLHINVTKDLLTELFVQAGPIRNVVHRNDFAFIEYEDEESVAYALALFDKIEMFGEKLFLAPKIHSPICFKYVNELRTYEQQIASNPANWWEKFGNRNQPIPAHICSANFAPQRSMPYMYAPAMEHRYGSHPYASSSSNSSHAHHNHAYHHQFEPSHHPQPSAYHPANYYQPEYVVNHYATGRAVYEPEPDAREYTGHPYASSSSRRGHKRDRPRSRTEKPPYNHHQGSRSNYR